MMTDKTKEFYEKSYKSLGLDAQRRYPNEELCRFMGRNFFHIPKEERLKIRILETGCGSGANLWMIAREGFDAYGIDLSKEALSLCRKMLKSYDTKASLYNDNMTCIDFEDNSFDAVVDVFSSNCLNQEMHIAYLLEVRRILKPGGKFFSYFPSVYSDTYYRAMPPNPNRFIDDETLKEISDVKSPFFGQAYPFRFTSEDEYESDLELLGFDVTYRETVAKTYEAGDEKFEWISIEGIKHA